MRCTVFRGIRVIKLWKTSARDVSTTTSSSSMYNIIITHKLYPADTIYIMLYSTNCSYSVCPPTIYSYVVNQRNIFLVQPFFSITIFFFFNSFFLLYENDRVFPLPVRVHVSVHVTPVRCIPAYAMMVYTTEELSFGRHSARVVYSRYNYWRSFRAQKMRSAWTR